jgi:hypothetical protein
VFSCAAPIDREKSYSGWIINGVQDYLILNIEQEWGGRDNLKIYQKAYKIWHEDQEATVEQKRALRIAELSKNIRSMKISTKVHLKE